MANSQRGRWRERVRRRDNFTCRRCGKYDEFIQVHHIRPKVAYPSLQYKTFNGLCLCDECHDWVHAHPTEAGERFIKLLERS